MSLVTSNNNYMSRLADTIVTSNILSFACWFRRDTDVGATESGITFDDDSSQHYALVRVNSSDRMEAHNTGPGSGAAWGPNPVAISSWYYIYGKKDATPSITTKMLADGETSFSFNQTIS